MKTHLEHEIASWDNRSSSDIEDIFNRHKDAPDFIQDITDMMYQEKLGRGASWLLKHYLEKGGAITKKDISKIYRSLSDLPHWETQLHILQSMPFMPIPEKRIHTVEKFIRIGLTHQNKFVRAWSYNGLYELTKVCPDMKSEVRSIFDIAMKDEAASVKARIRNIMKRGFE